MGQLFFKKPQQIAIREGCKRTTLRLWPRPSVSAGERGLGCLAIEAVEQIELNALRER